MTTNTNVYRCRMKVEKTTEVDVLAETEAEAETRAIAILTEAEGEVTEYLLDAMVATVEVKQVGEAVVEDHGTEVDDEPGLVH